MIIAIWNFFFFFCEVLRLVPIFILGYLSFSIDLWKLFIYSNQNAFLLMDAINALSQSVFSLFEEIFIFLIYWSDIDQHKQD